MGGDRETYPHYFGWTATMLGGAAELSLFLNEVAICRLSEFVVRSTRSTVLDPATPTHAVFPSNVRPPLRASVAPEERLIRSAPALPGTATINLLTPTGRTTTCDPLVPPRPLLGTRS